MNKKLIVVVGPTGVGKTEISLQMAEFLGCPIVSSDSRQLYRELQIGTAAPTPEQLQRVKHYFIGSHSIFDLYNAGQYELDALQLLDELFRTNDCVMVVGGSMMYVDALCFGIDDIPNVDEATRNYWMTVYKEKGLEHIQQELLRVDPVHYAEVDLKNAKRVLHALEVCSIAQKPFSELRTGQRKQRNFDIIKIGFNRERAELYERINARVDEMMREGLLQEATRFFEQRHLNTLNTVGYKELFEYMEGDITLERAIEKIKKDTRNYAKRQVTWFKKDTTTHWFHPDNKTEIFDLLKRLIH